MTQDRPIPYASAPDPLAASAGTTFATTTAISRRSGSQIWLRGQRVLDLVGRVSFEDVCGLLLDGRVDWTDALYRELGRARERAFRLLPRMSFALATPNPFDALRGALGSLPPEGAHGAEAGRAQAIGLIGGAVVLGAAWARKQRGLMPLAPDPAATHAEDLARLLSGADDPARASAIESYCVEVAEQGLCPATLAARLVVHAGSDPTTAVVCGIGALKGSLCGYLPAELEHGQVLPPASLARAVPDRKARTIVHLAARTASFAAHALEQGATRPGLR